MNRPTLIRKVYAELRGVVSSGESTAELLRTATKIAEAYFGTKRGSESSDYESRTSFESWAVDRVMANGGWRALEYEPELVRSLFEN